ncbi:hypothetical protein AK812_SmicGene36759 [Symbiodinium microadriaticum]|uniref:Uncharacterized protein n=1 Tax=Symbiodinium microadriaticum TaxID=2951 RepID=A0A1Q9CI08_SYMMI|nr:hypothetical protein AK812_SmicGene36759 [Symbiodinium microadriaticum]
MVWLALGIGLGTIVARRFFDKQFSSVKQLKRFQEQWEREDREDFGRYRGDWGDSGKKKMKWISDCAQSLESLGEVKHEELEMQEEAFQADFDCARVGEVLEAVAAAGRCSQPGALRLELYIHDAMLTHLPEGVTPGAMTLEVAPFCDGSPGRLALRLVQRHGAERFAWSLTGSLKGALKIPVVQVREWLALALPAHLLNWAFRTSADYEANTQNVAAHQAKGEDVKMPYYFGNLERDREQRPTSRLMRRVFDITDELQDNSQEDDNKNNSDGNDEELVVKMVHREVEKQLRISPDDTKENIIAKVGDVGADTALMTCVSSYTLQSGAVLCAQDNTPCTVCNMVHVNMRMQKLRNSRQQQAAYKRISAQLKPLHPPIVRLTISTLLEDRSVYACGVEEGTDDVAGTGCDVNVFQTKKLPAVTRNWSQRVLEIEADGQPESEEQGDNSKELRDSGKARKLARMIKSGTVPEDLAWTRPKELWPDSSWLFPAELRVILHEVVACLELEQEVEVVRDTVIHGRSWMGLARQLSEGGSCDGVSFEWRFVFSPLEIIAPVRQDTMEKQFVLWFLAEAQALLAQGRAEDEEHDEIHLVATIFDARTWKTLGSVLSGLRVLL